MSLNDTVFVDSVAKLEKICESLGQATALAVDTEFSRDKTYYPELGLIQIATEQQIALIDPLPIEDFSALKALFIRPDITKILHAARQDIEVLNLKLGVVPAPLFDTQLAASFLGLHEQISYAALVERYCQVTLPKAHTRTDWMQRPLSQEQLHYAAEDVYYLIRLYPLIRQELQARDRLSWCAAESAKLAAWKPAENSDNELWQQVSGQQRLTPSQLAILQALTGWRERRARQSNRPRKWILRDEGLIALARRAPHSMNELQKVDDLPPAVIERHGQALLQIIEQASSLAPDQYPSALLYEPLTPEQKNLLQKLSQRIRELAEQQQICAPLLANRRDLERLITRGEDIALFHDWRLQLAGNEIRKLLP